MPVIHVLDEKTINKIAAGEVVERPASVVKELVENSIDSGADTIEVEIAEGGTSYIRITDNGCGMSEEDARLAILRHATSKIRQVDDLFSIASLGFRGEALASISAVSRFTLTTRRGDTEMGTRLMVNGGTAEDCMPYGCSIGTTIEVADLFFNTPARKKFLKTERTEGSRIQDIVGKLAISNTEIAFKCIADGKVTILTPGNGSLTDTVSALYGFKLTKDILPILYEAENIAIDGVISKPSLIKSTRTWQTFIVNNRVITDKVIMKALDNAYHAMLPKGGYPLAVLRITIPAEMLDINVHPRKNEVKFSDEKVLFSAVYRAVLQGLQNTGTTGEQAETIAADVTYERVFDRPGKGYDVVRETTEDLVRRIRDEQYMPPVTPRYQQDTLGLQGNVYVPPSYTEEDKERFHLAYDQRIINDEGSMPTYSHNQKDVAENAIYDSSNDDIVESDEILRDGFIPEMIPLGQVAACYILAKKGDDLYIIDQHAAHERVRYDTLCHSTASIPSQTLLVPIINEATDDELAIVEEHRNEILDLGFDIEQGGPQQIRVQAIPSDLVESKTEEILQHVFTLFGDGNEVTRSSLRHEMLAYASCRGAIKAGHKLNTYQMATLIKSLFQTENPYVCPHGRPTIIRFTPAELGKLFLRT